MRVAVLVVALEPGLLRRRAETAVVVLGHRAQSLDVALERGLLREDGGCLEVVDARLARRVVHDADDGERTSTHLALACGGAARPQALFDRFERDRGIAPAGPGPSRHAFVQSTSDGRSVGVGVVLTAQERNVALLAATGARTTEIATAASISPRTVEHHLTRIYRKLGVRSKAELACALRTG